MEKERSAAPSSRFDEDDSNDDSSDSEWRDSPQNAQSSALDDATTSKPTPAIHDAAFEFIIPYAKYLASNASNKTKYYDLIQQSMLKKYPQFEGPRLRTMIQSAWSSHKATALKRYYGKLVLNKVSRRRKGR
uniref:HMG box domain-containing protein n=1 Tax=Bursaphelenchus xylophilus TaxID=6326 RepID=A0A1I7SMZ1_BURXY